MAKVTKATLFIRKNDTYIQFLRLPSSTVSHNMIIFLNGFLEVKNKVWKASWNVDGVKTGGSFRGSWLWISKMLSNRCLLALLDYTHYTTKSSGIKSSFFLLLSPTDKQNILSWKICFSGETIKMLWLKISSFTEVAFFGDVDFYGMVRDVFLFL